jgi:NADH-quinone oxidoreductase subunit E
MKQDEGLAPATADEPSADEVVRLLDALALGEPDRRGGAVNLIGILQQVQQRLGYLPANALEEVSRRTKVPLSRVHGVVSFYTQFHTSPRGRHTVRCCRGTACHVKGAGRILEAVQGALGIGEGETTPDGLFSLETVACLGTCFLAPAMMIDGEYFGKLTPQRAASILDSYRGRKP